MHFVIREPGPADVEAIVALNVATWREAYAHLLPEGFFTPEFEQGRRDQWHAVLDEPHPERTVRLAELDGEPAGWAFAGPSLEHAGEHPPRERQLYSIYVRAAHYGTGVGQALLDAVLGDVPAMLWVAKENPRATAFYVRNGFALDGVEYVDPAMPELRHARMVR